MKGHPKALVYGAAAAAVGLAIVLSVRGGGSVVQVDTGPLGGGPVHALQCGPAVGRRHTVAVGLDEVENSSGSPIRVERFALVDARGVKLLGVDLVPLGDGPLMGYGSPYPPSRASLAGTSAVWGSRRALPMTMEPGNTRWNLVYGLERTAKTGMVSYTELLYEYRGAQYLWTSQVAVEVVTGPACLAQH